MKQYRASCWAVLAIMTGLCMSGKLYADDRAVEEPSEAAASPWRLLLGGGAYAYTDFSSYHQVTAGLDLELQYELTKIDLPANSSWQLRVSLSSGWRSNDLIGLRSAKAMDEFMGNPGGTYLPLLWPLNVPLRAGLESTFRFSAWLEAFAALQAGSQFCFYPDTPMTLGLDALLQLGCAFWLGADFGFRLGLGYGLYGGAPLWGGPVICIGAVFGL